MLFPLCEPATQNLIKEKIEPPLSLEKGNLEQISLDEFIPEYDFHHLSPKSKKSVQEAIVLFKFLEKKEGASFAPVFTPLLGAIDDAAKAFVISTLKDAIPTDSKQQQRFFEPDLKVLHPRDESIHKKHGTNLRRMLLENDGIMPMGLLKWCLEYAQSPKVPPGGIFSAIKTKFERASNPGLLEMIDKIYSFRNTYIAHQEKELIDRDIVEQAMNDWISGLRQINENKGIAL